MPIANCNSGSIKSASIIMAIPIATVQVVSGLFGCDDSSSRTLIVLGRFEHKVHCFCSAVIYLRSAILRAAKAQLTAVRRAALLYSALLYIAQCALYSARYTQCAAL